MLPLLSERDDTPCNRVSNQYHKHTAQNLMKISAKAAQAHHVKFRSGCRACVERHQQLPQELLGSQLAIALGYCGLRETGKASRGQVGAAGKGGKRGGSRVSK